MTFDEYCDGGRETYAAFADEVQRIIEAALQDQKKLQQIQKRAKAKDSLKHRLPKDFPKDDAVETVRKDLAGVRLIFYTNSGAAEFRNQGILWQNFAIDPEGIKIHGPAEDKRYTAEHFVVSLKDDRAALPEYARFAGMKCEVQIHTILNHAWSEVEHDIIYKSDLPKGFGQRDKDAINERMKRVMDNYLIKAGIELDLVIRDHTRLMEGKELFERGVVQSIKDVANNNDLHHLLSNLLERVLGALDDHQIFAAEVVPALIEATIVARKRPIENIDLSGYELPGETPLDVAAKAADILDKLRYLDRVTTFNQYCDLYRGADQDERKIWIKNVESLARHDLEIWKAAGPIIQQELVARIKEFSADLFDLSGLILPALNQILSEEVTGSSMTSHDAFTWTTGSVVASDELAKLRSDVISVLVGMFKLAQDDDMRRAVFSPLSTAMRFPRYNQDEALRDIIRGNITNIVTFLTEQAPSLSFELRQHIEHSLYWAYWNSPRKPDVKS
jgi:ppGpp synthetase/RelA/SpoT-type nucleotidyltranferase